MANIVADRVKERISGTPGTSSTLTLSAAPTGFRRFSSVMSIGDTCYAVIENGAAWEIGIYTYSAVNTLTRTTVLKSSNSDALINVGSNAFVFISYIADKATYKDGSGRIVSGAAGIIFSDASVQTTAATTPDLSPYAPLASPTFTGVPAAPTAAGGTNTTQLATTAFVTSAVGAIDLSPYLTISSAASTYLTQSSATTLLAAKADLVGGLVPSSQIPSIAITEYLGSVASQAAMLALVGDRGDWCLRSDLGTTWVLSDDDSTLLASWTQLLYPTAPVTSVNGQTGAVSLIYSDVGAAAASHNHVASAITSGTINVDRLGSGSAGLGAKYLADDSTWKVIDLSGYVPYTGATGAVNLGSYGLTVGVVTASGAITCVGVTSTSVSGSGPSASTEYIIKNSSNAGIGSASGGHGSSALMLIANNIVIASVVNSTTRGFIVRSDMPIGFCTNNSPSGFDPDAYFVRNSASSIGLKGTSGIDGALTVGAITASGLLNLQNGTTPTEFNLHETYTSSTSRGYLKIKANAGAAYQIGSAVGSAGGTNRAIDFGHWNSAGTFSSQLSLLTSGVLYSTATSGTAVLQTFGGVYVYGGFISTPQLSLNGWWTLDQLSTGGVRFGSNHTITWGSSTIASTGDIGLARNAAGVLEVNTGTIGTLASITVGSETITQRVSISGSPTAFTITGAAHTTLTTAEVTDGYFNAARTVNFGATGGTIASQRTWRFTAPTFTAAAATTLTTMSTVSISGPPVASTLVTGTKAYTLNIESGELAINSASATSARMTEWIVAGTAVAYVRDDGQVVAGAAGFYSPSGGIQVTGDAYCARIIQGGSVVVLDRVGQFLNGNTTLKANAGIEIQPNSSYNVTSVVNSTNAQTFRAVGTFTSTTSYELINVKGKASANFEIGPENGSAGGTLRGLTLGCYPAGTTTIVGWAQFRPNTSTGVLEAFYLGPIADNTTTGGNARGVGSTDLSLTRGGASQVASGAGSFCAGQSVTASGQGAVALGISSYATNYGAVALSESATASGFAAVSIGPSSTASGSVSTAIGRGSIASNDYACAFGSFAWATGVYSWASSNAKATADYSTAMGVGSLADRRGQYVYSSGLFSATGDSQSTIFVLRRKTTDATPVNLMLDGSTTRLTIPSGKTMSGFLIVKGIKSDGSAKARFVRLCDITNVGGTTTLDTAVEAIGTDYNPSGCTLAVTAENATDDLQVNITGPAGETWRWTATFSGLEIAYGT